MPASFAKFRQAFGSLADPRVRRRRVKHPLLNLIVIALCATIAGADDWHEVVTFAKTHHDWLERYLDLSHGVPSHDTFERVFAMLDPIAFQKCLLGYTNALHELTQGRIISIDGKLVREAMHRGGEQGPMTLVSAWVSANHVFLGQVAGVKGSNELSAVPDLLDLLDLGGAIVTLDAMSCQKEIVAKIVEKGGDYVISVKGNQETLQTAVLDMTAQALASETAAAPMVRNEKSHGREEERIYTAFAIPENHDVFKEWCGAKSLLMAVRTHQDANGKEQTGTRYYLSSLPAEVHRLATASRNHWGIENSMHWVLDVNFNEDRSRPRLENAQANLGIFRRTSLSMIKAVQPERISIKRMRLQAGWDEKTLENVLFGRQSAKT